MKTQEKDSPADHSALSGLLPRTLSAHGFALGIGSFFASVFLANGIMVFYALSTFDGVETQNAYSRGRTYNHVLEADAVQAELGWQVKVSASPAYRNEDVLLNVSVLVTGENGTRIALAPIPLSLRRPTMQGMDATTTLTPQGNGRYAGTIRLAVAGNWIAWFKATAPDGRSFVHEERLFVPPDPNQPSTEHVAQ